MMGFERLLMLPLLALGPAFGLLVLYCVVKLAIKNAVTELRNDDII